MIKGQASNMIPVGYMAKRVVPSPDWLKADGVSDICSVSNHTSPDFADYIKFWKHNGYWLFDSPRLIMAVASENGINLDGTTLFYYEVYEYQYDEEISSWEALGPEASFTTDIEIPKEKTLVGYDIVSFSAQTSPECSLLACNHMAEEIPVNEHCLLATLEEARQRLENKAFEECEPGPYRIFAVYLLPDD